MFVKKKQMFNQIVCLTSLLPISKQSTNKLKIRNILLNDKFIIDRTRF